MTKDGNVDKAKGRVKEAAGDLTGDRDLEREGTVDQTAGSAKNAAGSMVDRIKGLFTRKR